MNRKKVQDGYYNLEKKIGTPEDVTSSETGYFKSVKFQNLYTELSNIYNTNSFAARIINIPIHDALKGGVKTKSGNEKANMLLNSIMYPVIYANQMARLYGGCWLYIIDDRAPEDEPREVKQLNVIEPDIVQIEPVEQNPLRSDYAKPIIKHINNSGVNEINENRLIYIDGAKTTHWQRIANNGLGISELERIYKEILGVYIAINRANNALDTLSLDVIAIEGLNDVLEEEGGDDFVAQRLQIVNSLKSILATIAIDANDKYYNVNKSLSGVTDVVSKNQELLAGASNIPYSKLFGIQKGGLNNKGEENITNYYDFLDGLREHKLKGQFERILQIAGYQDEVEFSNLREIDDEKKSIIFDRNASAIQKLFDIGVIETDEARKILGFDE